MEYRYAIIGCQHGHIALFLEEMQALGHECVGIYDSEPDYLARTLAARFQVPLSADPVPLLERADVIGCAAVNREKIDIVELCEKYGKPVMLDKPAVISREGLNRLEGVLNRGRIQVGMLLTERFRPSLVTLKHLIGEGQLGELVHIGMRKPHRLSPASRPAWFYEKERNGGLVVDLLIHDFDLLRWLTGAECVSFQGYKGKKSHPDKPSFYDWASLEVQLSSRMSASLYTDWHTPEASWTWGTAACSSPERKERPSSGWRGIRSNPPPSCSCLSPIGINFESFLYGSPQER
ncbi:Gfo/Idh/MocA family oxidoreductase [Paenibacillus sp. CC-CFT747]|nr:Gfo/Idh/MocA family oxidoreductase [Paenibacillus sp. CC-CFT747]